MKGLNAAEFELNEVKENSKECETDGIRISKATLKEKFEKLHLEDVLMFLRQNR